VDAVLERAAAAGPSHVEPTHIRTRRPDRREWNVGRSDVFVVITCVLDAGESRQETDLVVPVADAPGRIAASHLPSAPHPITDPPPATAMAGKTA
jgi:hypothetical protein